MESASAFSNGLTTTGIDEMDLDLGILHEFFDIDLASLSPPLNQSDFLAGSGVDCCDWSSRQLSTTHDQSGDLRTKTITPEQISLGQLDANHIVERIQHQPFNFTEHNSSSIVQHDSTLSSALSMQDFNHKTSEDASGGTDLRICEQGHRLETLALSDTEMSAELDVSMDWSVESPFYPLSGNISKNTYFSQEVSSVTHPQPTSPSSIELQNIYEELRIHKRTMDHVLNIVGDLCNRGSGSAQTRAPLRDGMVHSPQKAIGEQDHYPGYITLDTVLQTRVESSKIISGSGVALSSLPAISTIAQQQPSRKRPRVGRLSAHEICDSSWLVAPSRYHIEEEGKIERRPRTNLVKNPCFICRVHKKKCSGERPCTGCLVVDYRKILRSLEPCVALDENPFRFWTDNSLFGVVFDDENLFKLARIPNPLRKLELLWFIDSKTIRSGQLSHWHSGSTHDVRTFGTHILDKMSKWREFSSTYTDAQLLFIAAADILILFFVEVAKLYKQAVRVDLIRQTGSRERIETFINSSLRCIEQLLVPRMILHHKAQLGFGFGHSSLLWCLNTVKDTRPAIASQLESTVFALKSMEASTWNNHKCPSWWQLFQNGSELQFEPIVEHSIVYTRKKARPKYRIFSVKIRGDWVSKCEVGGSYHFGNVMGSENTALHHAVAYNNLFALQILLGRRARSKVNYEWKPIPPESWIKGNCNYVDQVYQEPIAQGCQPPEIAAIVLEERGTEKQILRASNVNAANEFGQSPLHLAARLARSACVEMLIQEGANVNAVDLQGRTPLHYLGLAVFASELDLRLSARLLCEAGADLSIRSQDGMAAIQGALLGGARFLQQMNDLGIDMDSRTVEGDTILHIVAREGGSSVVEILVEAGANIESINSTADTPLHLAAKRADPNMTECLVRVGADLHSANNIGDTPLHIAAAEGNLDTCKYLVRAGANVLAINDAGCDPLLCAATKGYFDVVEYLVKNGSKVTVVTNNGDTILHLVFATGYQIPSDSLAGDPFSVSLSNHDDYIPYDLAVAKENLTLVKYLVHEGCNVNAANNSGDTPLHVAVLAKAFDAVSCLLDVGANPYATNNAGEMAWPWFNTLATHYISFDDIDSDMDSDDSTTLSAT